MSARPRSAGPHPAPPSPRDLLVVQFRPYVLKVARELAEAVNRHVEIDDLIGWGHMGLVQAAERYDDRRGVRFRTFAHHRIKGAMLDGLRKEFSASSASVMHDEASSNSGSELRVVCADASYRQDDLVFMEEVRAHLADALETLTPLERAIVHHHYYNGQPVHLLASSTRLSKSWLSRVHTRALSKIRARLLERVSGPEAFL